MPSTKRRPPARTDKRLTFHKRLAQIRKEVASLKRDRASVQREEFAEMTKSLQELHKNTQGLATQLTRISQMQAELDAIKRALKRANLLD